MRVSRGLKLPKAFCVLEMQIRHKFVYFYYTIETLGVCWIFGGLLIYVWRLAEFGGLLPGAFQAVGGAVKSGATIFFFVSRMVNMETLT